MKGPTEIIGLAWVPRMACALFVIQMAACSSWRVEQVPPAQLVTEKSPHEVRISRVGQAPLVVAKPTIVGDSLIGVAQGATHGVPLADITTIATRQGSPLKSVCSALSSRAQHSRSRSQWQRPIAIAELSRKPTAEATRGKRCRSKHRGRVPVDHHANVARPREPPRAIAHEPAYGA